MSHGTNWCLTKSGKVYSCGENGYGQLGLGNSTKRKLFNEVNITIVTGNIIEIIQGKYDILILTDGGDVYGCGSNVGGDAGAGSLGINNGYPQKTIKKMILDSAILGFDISGKIIKVVNMVKHTIVLTDTGQVYGTGKNDWGQLGLNNTNDKKILTKMELDSVTLGFDISGKIIDVACGLGHTIVLTDNGKVYSCGYNLDGQLGLGDITDYKILKEMDLSNISSGKIIKIACSNKSTFVLTDDGYIYGCGYNNQGLLGLNNTNQKNILTQMKLSSTILGFNISGKIIDIKTGLNHAILLTDTGKVYGCGQNDKGQLGQGKTNSTTKKLVEIPIDRDVEYISCSYNSSYFLTEGGYLYGCGKNDGNFNDGTLTNKLIASEINPPTGECFEYIGGLPSETSIPETIECILRTHIGDEPTPINSRLSLDNYEANVKLNNFYSGKSESEKRDKRKEIAKRMLKKYRTIYNASNKLEVNTDLFDLDGTMGDFTKLRLFNASVSLNTDEEINLTNTINMSDLDDGEGFYAIIDNVEDTLIINTETGETVSITKKGTDLYQVNDNGTVNTGLEPGYSFDKYGIQFTIGSVIGGEGTQSSLSNICFVAETPIETDQGKELISKLIPGFHTINGKQIKAITETVTKDKFIYRIKKNAFKKNVPSRDTIITGNHLIEFDYVFLPVKKLIEHPKVEEVKYNGERLYNILMDKHEIIRVNNMNVETLHPNNLIARLYTNDTFKNMETRERNVFIKKFNKVVKERNVIEFNVE